MSIEIKVPQLPESVEEATIGEWHKKPGDKVERDENVVDLETDKVMLEVPSTSAGVIDEIKKEEGETVNAEDVLAILSEGSGADSAKTEEQEERSQEKSEDDKGEERQAKSADEESGAKSEEAPSRPASTLSPAVRKLVAEHDLDADDIQGSGKGGRILKSDVLEYLDQSETREETGAAKDKAPESRKAQTAQKASEEAEKPVPAGEREEQRVPMTRIRARIAERLVEAQSNAAMLTTFNEVDLLGVNQLRQRYKERFQKQYEVSLGYMSFFVKASVEALKRYPVVNAYVDDKDIVYHNYFDVGIAVSSPRGLVVPILRDADRKSYAEIEKQIAEFGRKTKDNKLTMDDLTGGTFSITNGGVFGSMLSTPILNPPQSAILGMHAIRDRPMVVEGEVKVRPVMYLALSYDHRIVDGREAVLFLRAIKDTLEDPARLLLQI